MSTLVEKLFGSTLAHTESWLRSLMKELETEDEELAYRVLRATLHVLRDRLPPEEALHLAAQLPMLLRGLYFEGWKPSKTPVKRRREAFLEEVHARSLDADPLADPAPLVGGVLRMLASHVTSGEIEDVRLLLPRSFNSLWED